MPAELLFLLFFFTKQYNFCNVTYSKYKIEDGYQLIHSTIIFKHGLHAPNDKIFEAEIVWNCSSQNWIYPGGNSRSADIPFHKQFRINPISEQSFLIGTCRAGEILETGYHQMIKFAKFIKETYQSLLPKNYNPRLLSFRSSYTGRCMSCIQILTNYLYPDEFTDSFKNPIDVFVADEELETLVPNNYVCPSIGIIYDNQFKENSSFSLQLNLHNKKLKHILKKSNFSAAPQWIRMPEYLSTLKCSNIPYPGEFNDKFLKNSTKLFLDFFNNSLSSENGRKYGTGLLISDIYIGMRDYLSGRSDSQIIFICGHTLSFISLFSAFQLNLTWPPYGSYFSFDLLQKNEDIIINIVFNGKILTTMGFKEFEQFAKDIRPNEDECQFQFPYIEKDKKSYSGKFLSMMFS